MDEGEPSRRRPQPPLGRPSSAPLLDDAAPAAEILADPMVRERSVPDPRSGGCDFRGAYVFAAGHSPSDALCGPKCHGTVAVNNIRAGNGPELESKFALCTRHSDLLWLLGYHGELRDGTLLHGQPEPGPAQPPSAAGGPL